MQSTPRAFAYGNATLFLGVIIYFFSQELIPFVEMEGWTGTLFSAGFILVFLNLSFVISRRFCRKTLDMEFFPYLIGAILVLPTLIFVQITERFDMVQAQLFFSVMVTAASMLGAYFGIQRGLKLRNQYLSEISDKGSYDQEEQTTRTITNK